MKDFEQKVETATFYRTFSVQFDTMQMIANALSRVPGRKSVLWITSNFPVKVDEGKKLLAMGNTTNANDQVEWWAMTTMYEKSVRMLNAANVSIYGAQPANDNEERTQTNNIPNFYVSPLGLTYVGLSDLGNRTGGTIFPPTRRRWWMPFRRTWEVITYWITSFPRLPNASTGRN